MSRAGGAAMGRSSSSDRRRLLTRGRRRLPQRLRLRPEREVGPRLPARRLALDPIDLTAELHRPLPQLAGRDRAGRGPVDLARRDLARRLVTGGGCGARGGGRCGGSGRGRGVGVRRRGCGRLPLPVVRPRGPAAPVVARKHAHSAHRAGEQAANGEADGQAPACGRAPAEQPDLGEQQNPGELRERQALLTGAVLDRVARR